MERHNRRPMRAQLAEAAGETATTRPPASTACWAAVEGEEAAADACWGFGPQARPFKRGRGNRWPDTSRELALSRGTPSAQDQTPDDDRRKVRVSAQPSEARPSPWYFTTGESSEVTSWQRHPVGKTVQARIPSRRGCRGRLRTPGTRRPDATPPGGSTSPSSAS